jgi:hypothetical protein
MEMFLDRGNPLHWIAVLVLLVSGLACAWLGIRDGLIRRTMTTSAGRLVGGKAVAAGVLYLATGLAGVVGAAAFLLGGR